MRKNRVRRGYTTTRRVHDPVRIRVSPVFRPSLPVRREVPFFSPEVPYRDYFSSLPSRSSDSSVRPVLRPRSPSRSVARSDFRSPLYQPGQIRVGGLVLRSVCVKRAVRSRVMHALGVAGSRVSRPTYSKDSSVRCS